MSGTGQRSITNWTGPSKRISVRCVWASSLAPPCVAGACTVRETIVILLGVGCQREYAAAQHAIRPAGNHGAFKPARQPCSEQSGPLPARAAGDDASHPSECDPADPETRGL